MIDEAKQTKMNDIKNFIINKSFDPYQVDLFRHMLGLFVNMNIRMCEKITFHNFVDIYIRVIEIRLNFLCINKNNIYIYCRIEKCHDFAV